jgi:hypothetical protein
MWLLLRRLLKGIGSSLNAPRCILSDGRRDFDVATIRDASPEELSLVLPRTIGTTGGRIADLTQWELFRPKDLALPRHFRGNGLGLGNSRQQYGSHQEKSNGSDSNSPLFAHGQSPHLVAAIDYGVSFPKGAPHCDDLSIVLYCRSQPSHVFPRHSSPYPDKKPADLPAQAPTKCSSQSTLKRPRRSE